MGIRTGKASAGWILAGMSVEERILEAAVERLAAVGAEGLTMSAVAEASGVSRPTVYAHFGSRDRLMSAALQVTTDRVLTRVTEQARGVATAADYVVEVVLAARTEFRSQPALAPVAFPQRGTILFDGDVLGPQALAMTRSFLAPLLEFDPRLASQMDEIAETSIRFLLSLVLFDSDTSRSDARLRDFLHRRLVPALGLVQ